MSEVRTITIATLQIIVPEMVESLKMSYRLNRSGNVQSYIENVIRAVDTLRRMVAAYGPNVVAAGCMITNVRYDRWVAAQRRREEIEEMLDTVETVKTETGTERVEG